MKYFSIIGTVALTTVLCWVSYAQAPDLSGDWRLDLGRSDLGVMGNTPPDIRLVVTLNGNVLTIKKTVTTSYGGSSTLFHFTTDGKECLNSSEHIPDLRGTASFQNGRLVIRSEQEIVGMAGGANSQPEVQYLKVESNEEYLVSDDGETLTISQILELPDGRQSMTMVFKRVKD